VSLGRLASEQRVRAFLVGGVVRDVLRATVLDRADLDVVVEGDGLALARALGEEQGGAVMEHARFLTASIRRPSGERIDVATARSERYEAPGALPRVMPASILPDLARRDFTINAMAVGVPDGSLVDPFGGVQALGARLLETPLEPDIAFSDDPLRMVRAARFVAQLDVAPSDRVLEAMRRMRDRLGIVSAERIRAELDKLLVAPQAAKGLGVLAGTGLADVFLPELPALRLEQDPVHQHKDVLRHTYAVVERCEPDLVLRLAGLLHDIGKPMTRQIGADGVSFHHHEVVGARMARERLTALRYPNAIVDDVASLIELHLRFHGYGEGWTDAAVRRYVRDAGPLLDRLNQLTRADVTTRNPERAKRFAALQDELEERIAALAEQENLEAMRPPLDGHQVMRRLGLEGGPTVGEALAYLMEVRIERGPVPEEEAYLLLDAWAKERGITE
jgi:poly(A) polymerase